MRWLSLSSLRARLLFLVGLALLPAFGLIVYTAAIVHHGRLDTEASFVQKPFTPDALARKAREVLDALGR